MTTEAPGRTERVSDEYFEALFQSLKKHVSSHDLDVAFADHRRAREAETTLLIERDIRADGAAKLRKQLATLEKERDEARERTLWWQGKWNQLCDDHRDVAALRDQLEEAHLVQAALHDAIAKVTDEKEAAQTRMLQLEAQLDEARAELHDLKTVGLTVLGAKCSNLKDANTALRARCERLTGALKETLECWLYEAGQGDGILEGHQPMLDAARATLKDEARDEPGLPTVTLPYLPVDPDADARIDALLAQQPKLTSRPLRRDDPGEPRPPRHEGHPSTCQACRDGLPIEPPEGKETP